LSARARPLRRRPPRPRSRRAQGGGGGSRSPRRPAHAVPRRPRPLGPRSAAEGGRREAVKDVVVVGAGIGGLTAAWQLRDLDTLVLEAEDRVGGRVKSFARGDHWVSVGAHMFPGEGSFVRALLDEL